MSTWLPQELVAQEERASRNAQDVDDEMMEIGQRPLKGLPKQLKCLKNSDVLKVSKS